MFSAVSGTKRYGACGLQYSNSFNLVDLVSGKRTVMQHQAGPDLPICVGFAFCGDRRLIAAYKGKAPAIVVYDLENKASFAIPADPIKICADEENLFVCDENRKITIYDLIIKIKLHKRRDGLVDLIARVVGPGLITICVWNPKARAHQKFQSKEIAVSSSTIVFPLSNRVLNLLGSFLVAKLKTMNPKYA